MGEIIIHKQVLISLLKDAAEMGANIANEKSGHLKPYMSLQSAYRAYGMADVKRWISEGLVTRRKDGNDSAKWRIERLQIEAVAKVSNRHTYLTVKERI